MAFLRQSDADVVAVLCFPAMAASTRSGVMGMECIRTPVALKTALASAAAVGMFGGSPTPIMSQLLPAFAMVKATGTISGISIGPAILYIMRSLFICTP